MYRIDNASAVTSLPAPGPPGTPGYFTDGNPAAALEATIVDAWWLNMLQEELLTVIEGVGITPSKTNRGQLYQALQQIFASGAFLPIAGGTMTGFITLHAAPVLPMHAANKQYVDQEVANVLAGAGYVALPPTGDNILYGQRNRLWTNVADYFLPLTGGTLSSPGHLTVGGSLIANYDIQLNDPAAAGWITRPNIAGQRNISIGVTGGLALLDQVNVLSSRTDFSGWVMAATIELNDPAAAGWITRPNIAGQRNISIGVTGAFLLDQVNVYSNRTDFSGQVNVLTGGLVANGVTAGASGIVSNGHVDLAAGNLSVSAGSVAVAGDITSSNSVIADGMYARGITLQNAGVTSHGNVVLRGTPAGAADSSLFSIWNVLTGAVWGIWTSGYQFLLGSADHAGNVGVGYLAVQIGAVLVQGNLIVAGTAHKPGGGEWSDSSDRRLKKDIARYQRGLQAVCALEPVSFKFNGLGDRTDDGETYIGLVAQDAAEIMPEMVGWKSMKLRPDDENEQSVATIDTTALKFALVNAVQELASRVEALERRS